MVRALDKEAARLGIVRKAVIKIIIAEGLAARGLDNESRPVAKSQSKTGS
jgi:hypothetical protein